jgi:RNA polymerase sigma-70 factor, ECF subfamily
MKNLSSETLMLKCKEGENPAFDILMQRHERRLIAFFADKLLDGRRRKRDWERAKDLAQETFLRAFNARATYEPKAKFTTWLYRIALNLYRDEIRRVSRHQTVSIYETITYETSEDTEESYQLHEAIADESIPTPQAVLEQSEQAFLLKTAIETLAPKHRNILILRYYDELDYAETAERLGCSIGTVKSRLYYANKALKRKMNCDLSPNA